MNNKIFLALASLFLMSSAAKSQSIASVNTVTGASSVAIPIDEVRRGQVAVPVTLVYSGSGIRPKDVEMNAGIGWQVQTGGQITRLVRGLPDDAKKDLAGFNISGWIYNSNQTMINSFTIQNDGTTCSKETTDLGYFSLHVTSDSDTEPDIFYVSAPGLSCQLVWDQSLATPGFRTIPYKDYVITPTFNATTGAITAITIVNDNGITYVFGAPENIKQQTVIASGVTTVNYFKNTYDKFKNGINYNNNWHLTSVTDQSGNGVGLTYTTAASPRSSTDDVVLWSGGASGAKTRIPQYSIKQTVTPQTLATIGQADEDGVSPILSFTWATSSTGQPIIQHITGNGKDYQLSYSNVGFFLGGTAYYYRSFLRSFADLGCSTPVNFKFGYNGETLSGYDYTTVLSDSTSSHIDYWGYYNSNSSTDLVPSLYVNPSNSAYPRYAINVSGTVGPDYTNTISGTNRSASAGAVAGSLNKIYYAQGGNSTIVYEPNDYLDVPSNTTIQGGGVRVKQIIDSAVNSPLAMVRNYSYKTSPFLPSSKSSGKPVSLPQYAFTTPYTGTATGNDYWSFSTIRSETDLSPEDHTIMYEYVRESKTGAGSTLYQYFMPATNWDNSASPSCDLCSTEWAPTINYVGRTNCSVSYGAVKNYAGSYPFAPNANYDFERGLPKQVTNYNDDGMEVSETTFKYQRTSASPVIIPGLAIDDNTASGRTVTGYSKYFIYASTSELTSSMTKKVFDLPGLTTFQTNTVNYAYNAGQHKLKQETAVNSDGSTIATNIQYVKDFTTSGTNADVAAIANLKTRNINLPVETYQQVTRGTTTYTTSASLTRFGAVSINGGTSYLPVQQLKFTSPDGDPLFTKYSITSGVPSNYSGYTPSANYTSYDYYGNLVTADDAHKHVRTVITNYYTNNVAAAFTNAGKDEVGFSDFDTYMYLGTNFTLSGTQVYASGSHTGNAVNFTTSQNFSKAIIKNTLTKRYIFSLWANPSASTTLTFSLTGASPVTRTITGTGTWKYFQFNIPVATLANSFTVTVTTSANIAVDDLLFYPENSEVVTYAYDPVTKFKSAETNTNGISAYYNYDQWGRLIYAYDRDKNIIQKNTYVLPVDLQTASSPVIGITGTRYVNQITTFATNGYNACTGFGISSYWDFGDGTHTTTSSPTTDHTYTSAGTYTVTLTATSPVFGTQTVTQTVTITTAPPPPPGVVTLSYNNHSSSNGDIVSVSFNDGVHTPTVVPAASLNGYTLTQGTYTIQVTFATGSSLYNASSGSGYACIYVSGNCWSQCKDFDIHNIYTYPSVNLSSCSTLNFSVNIVNCSTLLE